MSTEGWLNRVWEMSDINSTINMKENADHFVGTRIPQQRISVHILLVILCDNNETEKATNIVSNDSQKYYQDNLCEITTAIT